jgi:hypothetical protein
LNKDLIQRFIDQTVIAKSDYQLLDILWIFSYSLPSATAYKQHKDSFKRWLGTTCRRCLQKKHNMSLTQIRDQMNGLISLLNGIPDFLSYDAYYEDLKLLDRILLANTSAMLIKNVEQRVEGIHFSELESKILSFVLHYIPEKIQESLSKAEAFKAVSQSYDSKYMILPDFIVRENKETGEISHFTINTKEWTHLFNKMFDKELKEFRFQSRSSYSKSGLFMFLPYAQQYDEYSFWQFGDELVKLGVGYWIASLSAKGNVSLEFLIPKFIYDAIQPYKQQLPKIEGIATKVSNIEAEKQKDEWSLGEVTEVVEKVSDFSELEIEHSIVSNPSILEDDLEVVQRQFPTDVGFIDILCKDNNDDFVVVELKKGAGSFEVVGQIQKYMSWIHEHLAGTKQVKGIIVAKENDKQLEYAAKGSKFALEIKTFGAEAPVQANIKYCDSCGKPNKKSAKYCVKCGHELWL